MNRLPHWAVTAGEFAIFFVLVFGGWVFFGLVAALYLKGLISGARDHEALEVCLNGGVSVLGGLGGWFYFRTMQQGWKTADEVPPSIAPVPAPSAFRALFSGAGALLASLPIVLLVSIVWLFVLRRLGLPDEPQPLLAIIENAGSPLVIAGLLLVACGLAPLYPSEPLAQVSLDGRAGLTTWGQDFRNIRPGVAGANQLRLADRRADGAVQEQRTRRPAGLQVPFLR